MLQARNLDDQTYAEIMETALGQLPWLCPAWTDHNAHDPGITILELMAWYKEMQQYHMNQLTDELRCSLLKLVGIVPKPASPAVCAVEMDENGPSRPAGARLQTKEGIPFELVNPIPDRRTLLRRVCIEQGQRFSDVGHLLDRRITFQPFLPEDGNRSAFHIGFSQLEEGDLYLWFDVDPPEGVPRNPFQEPDQMPRIIRWNAEGAQQTRVLSDETHALSVSGCVHLAVDGWPKGEDGLYWLTLTLQDPGCEEEVRLSGLSASRYPAVQQETWAKTWLLTAPQQPVWETFLEDAQAQGSEIAVFLLQNGAWSQTAKWLEECLPEGRRLLLDTSQADAVPENVLVIRHETAHGYTLLFDAKGLPGETFQLDLEGRTVLTENFTLLCETLDRNGQVHPLFWRCVDHLRRCGPRDRVFTYDPVRETITFGDGEHGALLRPGKGAILAACMTLSYCGGGNIPAGRNLRFETDDYEVTHRAATGGSNRESVAAAQTRLLRRLNNSKKCVSAADYERQAKATPGLRISAAKAIPGWDPDEPTGKSQMPIVTIVVVPESGRERPTPDSRFLRRIQHQLDAVRPIGTCVRVIAPVYVDVSVTARIRVEGSISERVLARKIQDDLRNDSTGIGGTIRVSDVAAGIQTLPGVLQVQELELRASGMGCVRTREGDLQLPRRAIPCLKQLQMTYLDHHL